MSIIAWAILGLIAGALAKMLVPGRDPGGIAITMVIGVIGAVIGGFVWNLLTGHNSYGDLDLGGILIAVFGSVILLLGYRRFAVRA